MVKDYAKISGQSLRNAALSPQKSVAAKAAPSQQSSKRRANDKPINKAGLIVPVIIAVLIVFLAIFAFHHRDQLQNFKNNISTFMQKLHHGKSAGAQDDAKLKASDQLRADPTQSIAAGGQDQTLNLPANINLNSDTQDAKSDKSKNKPAKTSNSVQSQPQFDFYTVLPSGSATSSPDAGAVQNTTAAPPKPVAPPVSTSAVAVSYIVEAGVYTDQSAASQVRSQLLLLGLNPLVKTVNNNNRMTYYLELGPFANLGKAQSIVQQLQQNGINSAAVMPIAS